jgi:superfamily II DNA or RNA helicase
MTNFERKPDWFKPIDPYEFQWEIFEKTINHIRTTAEPGYIYASVSAGKTIMQAMLAKHGQMVAELANKQQLKMLFLARTGELVEQNAEEMWGMKARNSVYSASLGLKRAEYPVIVGSEGTVCRSLDTALKDFIPDVLLIDECHQLDYESDDSQYMKIVNEMKRRKVEQNTKLNKCPIKNALRIIGYTGSPFRGTQPIKGPFWKHQIYKIDMWELVSMGFVHGPVFGFAENEDHYDFSGIDKPLEEGTEDYSRDQLKQMEKVILEDKDKTAGIMRKIIAATASRNCVLITCSGRKHIEECAQYLPEGSYAVISDKTPYKDRRAIKEGCNNGTIKYVLQIGCWTVGVNIPPIDTIVILRRIGSLTLLIQLIGRGIRKLKDYHRNLGMEKHDCLVLDFSDTMAAMGEMFNDPILEAANQTKAERDDAELKKCFRCNFMNGEFARRCMGREIQREKLAPFKGARVIRGNPRIYRKEPDGRCGFFFVSKVCEACGVENDKAARSCRHCDAILIDPNANLNRKAYSDADLKDVIGHKMEMTKNDGVIVSYQLPDGEVAVEKYWPGSPNKVARDIWYNSFVARHVTPAWRSKFYGKPARFVMGQMALFDWPVKITHRLNDKGDSIIARKVFSSGRTEEQ